MTPEKAKRLNPAIKLVPIDELLAESDFITLHVPYNDSTKGMINKEAIAKMKDGVNIINCARGELVVGDDIVEAVKSGKVNRYACDFASEAIPYNTADSSDPDTSMDADLHFVDVDTETYGTDRNGGPLKFEEEIETPTEGEGETP